MTPELTGLRTFVEVARTGSFRAAADNLGVTRSAVSQTLRRLEDRLGVALVRRTTRSVSLTEAGRELQAAAAPLLEALGSALEQVRIDSREPRGRLRLAVSSIAERFLSGPLLAEFAERRPAVTLDVTVTDEAFDVVARGYDAGVRLGEVLEQDVVAVPVSGDQREIVVAAPSYVARFGAPAHPCDLQAHRCIGWRPSPDAAPHRWEFTEDGRDVHVVVDPQVTTNDMWLMARMAAAGGGVTHGMEETFRPWLARGELVTLLDAFSAPFPGFFLYYPRSRNNSAALRAFIEHVRYKGEVEPGSS